MGAELEFQRIRDAIAQGETDEAFEIADRAWREIADADRDAVHQIEHDGFCGTQIGSYVTREGKRGVVLQHVGTKVVHVYGEKWFGASPEGDAVTALRIAIDHIDHMAAWIADRNAGYSFEGLGEDMPGMRAALGTPAEGRKPDRASDGQPAPPEGQRGGGAVREAKP